MISDLGFWHRADLALAHIALHCAQPMSAFGSKADIGRKWVNVRF